jgi:hypothetical protein
VKIGVVKGLPVYNYRSGVLKLPTADRYEKKGEFDEAVQKGRVVSGVPLMLSMPLIFTGGGGRRFLQQYRPTRKWRPKYRRAKALPSRRVHLKTDIARPCAKNSIPM